MPSAQPPLSVAEIHDKTGIPKRTIQAAIARGELGAHKLAGLTGAYVVNSRDLDKFLAKRGLQAAS